MFRINEKSKLPNCTCGELRWELLKMMHGCTLYKSCPFLNSAYCVTIKIGKGFLDNIVKLPYICRMYNPCSLCVQTLFSEVRKESEGNISCFLLTSRSLVISGSIDGMYLRILVRYKESRSVPQSIY